MVGCRAMAGLCGLAKNVATSPQAAANDSHKPGIAHGGDRCGVVEHLDRGECEIEFRLT